MQSALDMIRRDKVSANKVKAMLDTFHNERMERSMKDGMYATNMARMRVRNHILSNQEKDESDIQNLIKKQTNALHATNLERLLTKKWSEYPNAYQLMSKIPKFSKKEDRVNQLMGWDRYNP